MNFALYWTLIAVSGSGGRCRAQCMGQTFYEEQCHAIRHAQFLCRLYLCDQHMCCDGLFMAAIAAVMAVRYDDGLQERNKRRESGDVSYASQDALESPYALRRTGGTTTVYGCQRPWRIIRRYHWRRWWSLSLAWQGWSQGGNRSPVSWKPSSSFSWASMVGSW